MWTDGGPREFGSAGVRASRPWRHLGSVARLRCRTGVKRATRPPTYDPQHVSCIAIHTKGVTTMARPSPMVFAGLSADSSIDVTRPNGISNGIRPLGLRRTSVPTNLSPSILAWSTRGTARGPEPEQSQLSGGGGIDVASRTSSRGKTGSAACAVFHPDRSARTREMPFWEGRVGSNSRMSRTTRGPEPEQSQLSGGGGIRTHESLRTPVFKTGALNRSATPPVLRAPEKLRHSCGLCKEAGRGYAPPAPINAGRGAAR